MLFRSSMAEHLVAIVEPCARAACRVAAITVGVHVEAVAPFPARQLKRPPNGVDGNAETPVQFKGVHRRLYRPDEILWERLRAMFLACHVHHHYPIRHLVIPQAFHHHVRTACRPREPAAADRGRMPHDMRIATFAAANVYTSRWFSHVSGHPTWAKERPVSPAIPRRGGRGVRLGVQDGVC